jgi:hypothetical protein
MNHAICSSATSNPITSLGALQPHVIASSIWFDVPCAAAVTVASGPFGLRTEELLSELVSHASLFQLVTFSFDSRGGEIVAHWRGSADIDGFEELVTRVRREMLLISRIARGDGPRRALLADLAETLAMAA